MTTGVFEVGLAASSPSKAFLFAAHIRKEQVYGFNAQADRHAGRAGVRHVRDGSEPDRRRPGAAVGHDRDERRRLHGCLLYTSRCV